MAIDPTADDLVRLSYISQRQPSLTDDEVVELALAANRANRIANITGCLWFGEQRFFQILEGRRHDIDSLYEKIRRDPRHNEVRLLSYVPLKEREFGRWGLAHLKHDDDQSMGNLIHEYAGVPMHPPEKPQEHSLLRQLLDCFVHTLRHRTAG
jgi:hypothetical protein